MAGLPHDGGYDRRHQQCAAGGLCGFAAVRPIYLSPTVLYECRGRDLPGELWHPSTLSDDRHRRRANDELREGDDYAGKTCSGPIESRNQERR